ncbi:hypothetical protein O9K51_04764 [Purpureocillium lavendulum]|uniref:Uncharacterized protein n=1 Tax=Purpureocillium lavendulum TaxID=1247861 RepID=A0AB34FX51_9HYPO|nr:hypothetical protein O9K51_04764 [Purpureocillium lavendulum]
MRHAFVMAAAAAVVVVSPTLVGACSCSNPHGVSHTLTKDCCKLYSGTQEGDTCSEQSLGKAALGFVRCCHFARQSSTCKTKDPRPGAIV